METLEELKAIVENAPVDATHFNGKYYIEHFYGGVLSTYIYQQGFWHQHSSPIRVTRSLSDIKRIIELMELVEDNE